MIRPCVGRELDPSLHQIGLEDPTEDGFPIGPHVTADFTHRRVSGQRPGPLQRRDEDHGTHPCLDEASADKMQERRWTVVEGVTGDGRVRRRENIPESLLMRPETSLSAIAFDHLGRDVHADERSGQHRRKHARNQAVAAPHVEYGTRDLLRELLEQDPNARRVRVVIRLRAFSVVCRRIETGSEVGASHALPLHRFGIRAPRDHPVVVDPHPPASSAGDPASSRAA